MSGFIKLHRGILEWEWYRDQNTCSLFIHLLLSANYKPSRFMGHDIPAGSKATGLHSLAEQTGLSISQIRTSLKKLEITKEIAIKKTNKFSIISITNWDRFQGDDKQIANGSQTNDTQIATSKEGKKGRKKEKGIYTLDDFRISNLNGSIEAWFKEKAPSVDRFVLRDKIVAYCESKGKSYRDYFAAMRAWALKDQAEKSSTKQGEPENSYFQF